MNTYVRAFVGASIAICALNLFSIDQAQAQTGCYNGIVLERDVSLTSTGVKASWTVPTGRLGVSVSRSFQAELRNNQRLAIDVEVVRNSVVYHVERFGIANETTNRLNSFTSDLPIFLESGDTIRLNMIDSGLGQGTFTLSVSNCPDPFSP